MTITKLTYYLSYPRAESVTRNLVLGKFAVKIFAVGNFALRNFRRKEISPYENFTVGNFAVRKFRRIKRSAVWKFRRINFQAAVFQHSI